MEEAVEKLITFTSSGANWPYALAQLCKDAHHAPLPKNKHLGILPQGKVQETFCGQISQLEVCQLLGAGPQVIYPIGLSGHDEPIITTLPEPLDSGISLITSEHIYFGIDIPSSPVDEPDQKMPPLEDIPTILVTSPPKSEGSMTTEVSNLLSWAVLEASSCESQHSSPRRPTTAVIFMSPPWKPEDLPWPADTSSQASINEGEASLEDIPTNISPIAASSGSRSISPLVDLAEVQINANKALDELLSTKGSIDARRQMAVWELGMMLHQNESQVAASIKEPRVICSKTTLDIWTACSQSLLEAKTSYLAVVKEAKTTRGHLVQEAEVTCSKAICEAEAQKISQATMLHKEHGKCMQDLEEQALGEESRSHNDFLSACQVILYSSPPLFKGTLAASYHILLGQTPLLPPLILPQRASPMEEQPTTAGSPTLAPRQSPRPKRWHPSPDPMEIMPIGGTPPQTTSGGPPSPKRQAIPPWFKTLKPNSAEVFSQDSNMVKEARREYFSKHSYNFTSDGNHNLSGMFKYLATSTGLLGTSIYKTQSPWTGPEELKLANYVLLSLPKGLKFLWAVPPSESPKLMGLMGIHDPDALCLFSGVTYCPWCRKEGQNEGTVVNHLQTTHYRLGLVCDGCYGCPSIMSDTLCCHGQHDCHQLGESIPSKSGPST